MFTNVLKLCQRRIYDLISSRKGLSILLFCGLLLLISVLHFGEILIQWSTDRYHDLGHPFSTTDNLASRSFMESLCAPAPIDVVYTWVNGSDTQMLRQLKYYKALEESILRAEVLQTSNVTAHQNASLACYWQNCYRWNHHRLLLCPNRLSKLKSHTITFEKSDTFRYFVPSNASSSDNASLCVSSSVFATPDATPKSKLLIPGALWITGRPFLEKESRPGHLFVSQLNAILQHALKGSEDRVINLHYFHEGSILFCHPMCNDTVINLTLSTFSSLSLTWKPVYIVWNDTGALRKSKLVDNSTEDAASRSRYEDNDELRFSLRSVQMYAPWIRRIYLVTNGQVPSWLRLDHPRLKIIRHQDIFANASHLPTFNSASIEMHLHRIPGLSRYFIYMNDDVFFGAPVSPDDFFTHARGHRVYLTWAVPNCRTGCPSNWLNDGYCDKACNYPECDFDAGDCGVDGLSPKNRGPYALADNAWADAVRRQNSNGNRPPVGAVPIQHVFKPFCHGSCADAWLGDGTCDSPCNRIECAFDSGDCGDVNFEHLCAITITNKTKITSHTIVPPGISEFIIDFSSIFPNGFETGKYWSSPKDAMRAITLVKKYKLITVLLHRNLNVTDITLSLSNKNESFTINLRANTDRNGTCPPHLFYQHHTGKKETINFPTMLPYPEQLRTHEVWNSSKINSGPSAELGIIELEKLINEEITTHPNSTKSAIFRDSVKELETKWTSGYLTDSGYRFFMWQLLSGSDLQITAAYRRSQTSESNLFSSLQPHKRHLLDMYADSLRFSNKLFSRQYGHLSRRVPGHMPHFIDSHIVSKLEKKFKNQWQITSRHRFRNSKDLQFAFTYFYFLMSEKMNRTLKQWLTEFDNDHSSTLNHLEMRAIALQLWGLPFQRDRLGNLLYNCTGFNVTGHNFDLPISLLENCTYLENVTSPHLINGSRYKHEITGEDEIWFKMLNANSSRSEHHFDEIRSRKRKFICLNDNIDHAGKPVESLKVRKNMRDLLMSMYPHPSQFELSDRHGFTRLKDWQNHVIWKRRFRTLRAFLLFCMIATVCIIICRRQFRVYFMLPLRFCRKKLCRRRRPIVV